MKEHPDIIFSDACVQFFQINEDLSSYLGDEVISLIHRTDPRICNRASSKLTNSFWLLMGVSFLLVEFLL